MSCTIPQGILRRSGVGYNSKGELTPLDVKDFSAILADQVKSYNPPRWLFVNLPKYLETIRLRAFSQKPEIVRLNPNNYYFPTRGGSSWTSGSGWFTNFKFDPQNPNLLKFPQNPFGIDSDLDGDGKADCGSTIECQIEAKNIINTIIGKDPNSGTIYRHRPMGAIYHSTPVVSDAPKDVFDDPNYRNWINTTIAAGSFGNVKVKDRPSVLYIGTNDGILHAFSVETGFELWGVIPATILKNLPHAAKGAYPDGSRVYTVDGTPLVKDVQLWRRFNPNGDSVARWATVLIVGFRAGGRGYLALDVTNPYRPRVLWEINYNSYFDPSNPSLGKFSRLGYTFAQPYIANVLVDCRRVKGMGVNIPNCIGNQERAVAVIPGGVSIKKTLGKYLIDQNGVMNGDKAVADGVSYIYIVDLESGKLIRALRVDNRVVTGGGRGFASTPIGYGEPPALTTRVFVGDVLGRIFRIDLSKSNPKDWKVSLFFELFKKPETPMMIMSGLSAAINNKGELVLFGGTGDIENPNFIHSGFNKIFSLREKINFDNSGQITSIVAVPNFIFKLNKYLVNENSTTAKPGPEHTVRSYTGEKLTGPPVIFNGTAYFTTYVPSVDLPVCGVPGFARFYGIHFNDQCRTSNCANLIKVSRHFYQGYLGRVNHPDVTPINCCEKDRACNSGSETPYSDQELIRNPNLCGDLSYTVPMLRYMGTSPPYEYFRYLSLGANTLVMGATYNFFPGQVSITTVRQQGKTVVKVNSVRRGSYFISFRVAGKNPASSTKFKLEPMRAVKVNLSLKEANFTTVKTSDRTPPVTILSWGALLDE